MRLEACNDGAAFCEGGAGMKARGRRKRTRQAAVDETAPPEPHMRILQTIRRIPPGSVATYGQVAEAAGYPGRARLVGYVLKVCPLADGAPWHRVANATGRISDRPGGGSNRQRRRLEAEGVTFTAEGRIDLTVYRWRP